MNWTPEQLPDLNGKIYVITGGNGGIGFEAAKLLARKGGRVVITTRSESKAQTALSELRAAVPQAQVDFVLLDLAEPASVAAAVKALHDKCPRVDALINNAGVMQTPEVRTSEGFELQLATNHLGHFRLNARMMDLLEASGGRIVAVSSVAHRSGTIALDDLQSRRAYSSIAAYSQSKLANLMYAFELQRRLAERASRVTAIACHPGYAATNLQSAGVGMEGGSRAFRWAYKVTNALLAQSAERGAFPLALAAAGTEARPGAYYGPTRFMDSRGPVGESTVAPIARDEVLARELWEKTEALVGPFFAERKP